MPNKRPTPNLVLELSDTNIPCDPCKHEQPATKGDITALESRLTEAMRDMQTEVLGAFYGFSQTIQDRFKGQDGTESSIKTRMTTLESRLLEIEKRLHLPPSAA